MKTLLIILSLFVLESCRSTKFEDPQWLKDFKKEQEDKARFEVLLEGELGQSVTYKKMGLSDNRTYLVFQIDATGEIRAYNYSKWDKSFTLDSLIQGAIDGVDIISNMETKSEWQEMGYYNDIKETVSESQTVYNFDCGCYETKIVQVEKVVGQEWVDTSGYINFYYGGGFRFTNTGPESKDLETKASLKERLARDQMALTLSSKFSLSEDRASELAKLTLRYQKLENLRALTDFEKDHFALEALGVSLKDVESALKSRAFGNEDPYLELLKKAAQVNGSTPETIGLFFDSLNE